MLSRAGVFLTLRSQSVAVGTDNIAFRCFRSQFLVRHQHGAPGHEIEQLRLRVAMIEVHLVRLESLPAIGTRHLTPLAEHLSCPGLPNANAKQLGLSVAPVIRNVGWTLISSSPRHRQF